MQPLTYAFMNICGMFYPKALLTTKLTTREPAMNQTKDKAKCWGNSEAVLRWHFCYSRIWEKLRSEKGC